MKFRQFIRGVLTLPHSQAGHNIETTVKHYATDGNRLGSMDPVTISAIWNWYVDIYNGLISFIRYIYYTIPSLCISFSETLPV